MGRRTSALLGAVAVALAATALVAADGPATRAPLGERVLGPVVDGAPFAAGLERATTCEELTGTLRDLATRAATSGPGFGAGPPEVAVGEDVGATDGAGTGGAAAPAAGGDATNVQVVGVDEPDVVERQAGRVLTGFGGVLRVVEVVGGVPAEVGNLELAPWGDLGLLAVGEDRVVALSRVEAPLEQGGDAVSGGDRPTVWRGVASRLGIHLVDLADPTAPALLSSLALDGELAAARSVDGVLRLAVRTGPPWVDVWSGKPLEDEAALAAAVEAAYAATTTADWLPEVRVTGPDGTSTTRPAVACDRVGLPQDFSGLGMLTMAVVDATGEALDLDDAEAVVSSGETLYATADRLVVATSGWGPVGPMPFPDPALVDPAPVDPAAADAAPSEGDVAPGPDEPLPVEPLPGVPVVPPDPTTQLHLFDVDRTLVDHVASGEVAGRLVDQFALSIHEGVLRTAVTTGGWGGATQSSVVTHRVAGDELVEVGRVDGLGPDEDIQSVRFLGDTAYVVTFRRTDPLYVVDLADPAAPRTLGELKIEGYSSYLHPLGPGRLLGVGQDADPQTGMTRGVQVSTFDVRDATAPRRIDVDVVPNSTSEAEWNHLAVTVADGLVALPVERWGEGSGGVQVGTLLHRVDDAGGLERLGVLAVGGQRWERYPRRSLLLDDRVLLTASDGGVTTWDVATLSTLGSTTTPLR